MAVNKGIILPIYSILAEDYNIIITDNLLNEPLSKYDLFKYGPFPLNITNNKIVISDIYALIRWDSLFYQNLQPHKKESFSQYAIVLENGNYSVDIIGFFESESNFGYKIILSKVDLLPSIKGDIDSFNYNVVKLVQANGRMNIMPEKH